MGKTRRRRSGPRPEAQHDVRIAREWRRRNVVQVRILPGLPGGAPYVSRAEIERRAGEQVRREVEALRRLSLSEFVKAQMFARYGGIQA